MGRRFGRDLSTESNDIARRLIYGEWPHGPVKPFDPDDLATLVESCPAR
jgi:hypothetical protein